MDTHVWQALPPRKKSRGSKETISTEINNNTRSSATNISENTITESVINNKSNDQKTDLEKIKDNILARSIIQRANATLESKDGCAGEFYECMLLLIYFLQR